MAATERSANGLPGEHRPAAPAREPAPVVQAIIVTHDDPVALRRCIESLSRQTVSVGSVLVIDTAGRRPAETPTMSGLDVAIVRLADNVGPAGGWAAGLGIFSDGRADFAWLFDDDCAARPDALERALAYAAERDAHVVQSTMLDSSSGADVSTQGWCGVLVHRAVVEAVGVPDESLVWWTEDTEYLHWRIPRAGWTVGRSADSIVELPIRPTGGPKPSWKYYYEARNQVAYRLRTQRPGPSDRPIPRYLSRRVRYWRAGRSVAKLIGRALLVEDAHRLAKLSMVIRGSWGGVRGQRGLVVPIGTPDRARHALDRDAP